MVKCEKCGRESETSPCTTVTCAFEERVEIQNDKHNLTVRFNQHDGQPLWKFSARWDGCVDIYRFFNGKGEEDQNHLHICDIDEMIAKLQRVRQEMVKAGFEL